uniref:Gametocyte-specific factor 1 homolog n=1 Tax=Diabrotica virgifera virgifera TaxID=50390 RepID=A0A6P7GPX9_DIAVI
MAERNVCCPFNPLHIMPQSTLQRHIIKCMVNYPDFVTCPYNALHRFANKTLLGEHMIVCDSRDKKYVFQDFNDNCPASNHQTDIHTPANAREFNLEFEDWDTQY